MADWEHGRRAVVMGARAARGVSGHRGSVDPGLWEEVWGGGGRKSWRVRGFGIGSDSWWWAHRGRSWAVERARGAQAWLPAGGSGVAREVIVGHLPASP